MKKKEASIKYSFSKIYDFLCDFAHLFVTLFAIISMSLIFRTYVCQFVEVHGSSMYPTLIGYEEGKNQKGDILLVSKIPYMTGTPERFDIVVFPIEESDLFLIKRIVGLPGENILIKDGLIYIDGILLEENYGYEKICDAGLASDVIHIGKDEYFVLGDNRNNSMDSRCEEVGLVKKSEFLGKVITK